jgi:uncharacterized membrane protein
MKKSFVTGLAILLPLAVTIGILLFVINFLTDPFLGIMRTILDQFGLNPKDAYLVTLSQILILIFLFLFTVLVGFCARMFFVHALLKVSDFILLRIPFVSSLYKATQEIIKTLFYSPTKSFKQVALVPYPNKDTYTLGLITGRGLEVCENKVQDKLISVYVPTTPNPTSGYLLMFKESDILLLDMKVEEALKYIISCGVLQESNPLDP